MRSNTIDPDDPVLPDGIAHPSTDSGEVVALLVEEGVRAAGWGVRVAIDIASEWSRGGARVVLCDADLVGASLHGALGAENLEGVADLIHFGASPPRVTRRVEGRDFLFVPSGTVLADSPAVYRHPRWSTLLDAYRQSGTVLLLYLPAEVSGVEALSAGADRVIRLASSRPVREPGIGEFVLHVAGTDAGEPEVAPEDPAGVERPSRGETRSTVGSGIEVVTEDADERGGARSDRNPQTDASELHSAAPASDGDGTRGSEASRDSEAFRDSGASRDDTSSPGPPGAARGHEPRRITPWLVLLLLVVVAAVLVSAWFGWVPIPGLTPGASTG